MTNEQNKLKLYCKYQYKLIDSYVSILRYYKDSKNYFESELNVTDDNDKEVNIRHCYK